MSVALQPKPSARAEYAEDFRRLVVDAADGKQTDQDELATVCAMLDVGLAEFEKAVETLRERRAAAQTLEGVPDKYDGPIENAAQRASEASLEREKVVREMQAKLRHLDATISRSRGEERRLKHERQTTVAEAEAVLQRSADPSIDSEAAALQERYSAVLDAINNPRFRNLREFREKLETARHLLKQRHKSDEIGRNELKRKIKAFQEKTDTPLADEYDRLQEELRDIDLAVVELQSRKHLPEAMEFLR